ncbi:hypothetical protein PVAP13_1NG177519 [Panicum virgatum]|uniref:Uncharacterized protein n=1 Tax=Panicum virgatum TaxID=38727 RepID=A0A8T0WW80_PANVG|nr:hypothetical protein PVAP13_1NG177519 [Panicum virgatum]
MELGVYVRRKADRLTENHGFGLAGSEGQACVSEHCICWRHCCSSYKYSLDVIMLCVIVRVGFYDRNN